MAGRATGRDAGVVHRVARTEGRRARMTGRAVERGWDVVRGLRDRSNVRVGRAAVTR
jgi:hypothetical protein